MTHPTKPAAGAPEAVLSSPVEDDKARAGAILGKHFFADAISTGLARDIIAEFARIRADVWEAALAVLRAYGEHHGDCASLRAAECNGPIEFECSCGFAAAIRSRGPLPEQPQSQGSANEKG